MVKFIATVVKFIATIWEFTRIHTASSIVDEMLNGGCTHNHILIFLVLRLIHYNVMVFVMAVSRARYILHK